MGYRQGVGPNRLPQGAATALNAQPQPRQQRPAATPPELENDDIPIEYAQGEDEPVPNDDNGLSEEMQVLLEPPNPQYRGRVMPKDREGRVPRYVVRHLPQLMAASKDPSAHPTLRAYYNSIVRHLEQEMRQGGR